MRVFVAGGAGAIGKRLIGQLVARGHQVTASATTPIRFTCLRELGCDPIVMDGLDAQAVLEAVARAEPDVIVHQMTALGGRPDLRHFDRWFATTNALRTTGTENLLQAADENGVRRLVAQSYTGWTNARSGAALKTEDDPLDPTPAPEQVQSLAAIRFLEDAVTGASLQGVALRYGALYGADASQSLVTGVRKRRWPIVGGGAGVWSWIHVDDAAAATVAAVEGRGRGIYNIVDDDPAPVSEWLPEVARVLGAKRPHRVPTWTARIGIGSAGVQWMTQARGAVNDKAKRELGWRPMYPTWRRGFSRMIDPEPFGAVTLDALIGQSPVSAQS